MAKRKKISIPNSYIRGAIVVIFVLFLVFLGYTRVVNALTTSPLFKVKEIVVDPAIRVQAKDLNYLRGRNIFHVDIRKLHKQLYWQYPQISDLRVSRKFPDQIHIVAEKRNAFVHIAAQSRYLILDEEGFALFYVKDGQERLPLIKGINLNKAKISRGKKVNIPELRIALDIIRNFQSDPLLSRRQISVLDINNLSNITLHLSNGLQIVIDQENISRKLNMLSLLVAQNKLNLKEVEYIDLRFNEPVVGRKGEDRKNKT